jgi:transposase
MAIPAALPRPGVHPWPMDAIPDPEVPERPAAASPRRTRWPCSTSSTGRRSQARKGAIIRREGLYRSHITEWRRLRALGGLEVLGRSRGPRPAHPLVAENERLRDKVGHLEARLTRAENVIAVRGNVSVLLRELSLEGAEPKPGR